MTKEKYLEDITEIRSMMEQSSRFLSLSGLSGISAGVVALLGATVIFWKFNFRFFPFYEDVYHVDGTVKFDYLIFLLVVAGLVLVTAISLGFFFTTRKARKHEGKFWTPAAKRLLTNLFIPLVVGGIFCIALLIHNQAYLIGSATLIFYGLALLNASKYTLNDIRYLGIAELCIGTLAAFITGYSLLFWAIGFGLLHIVYGYIMYFKYDK